MRLNSLFKETKKNYIDYIIEKKMNRRQAQRFSDKKSAEKNREKISGVCETIKEIRLVQGVKKEAHEMGMLEDWKRLKQENESLKNENEILLKTIRQMQKTQDRLIVRYITGTDCVENGEKKDLRKFD